MQITLMSPSSGVPARYSPLRISATAEPTAETMGQPGTASWKSTTALSSSAMLRIDVPSTLIGPVVPIWGIGNTKIGHPACAIRMCASVISPSCWSGAIVQLVADQIGRSRSEAPETVSRSSIITGAWSGVRTSSCRCLRECSKAMRAISRLPARGSTSPGVIVAQVKSISGTAS